MFRPTPRTGFDFIIFKEELSEIALPSLLKEKEGRFDLIFIDGLHSYDQVMLDFYYANRLIRIGGFIVFDDTWVNKKTGEIDGKGKRAVPFLLEHGYSRVHMTRADKAYSFILKHTKQ